MATALSLNQSVKKIFFHNVSDIFNRNWVTSACKCKRWSTVNDSLSSCKFEVLYLPKKCQIVNIKISLPKGNKYQQTCTVKTLSHFVKSVKEIRSKNNGCGTTEKEVYQNGVEFCFVTNRHSRRIILFLWTFDHRLPSVARQPASIQAKSTNWTLYIMKYNVCRKKEDRGHLVLGAVFSLLFILPCNN